MTASPHAVFDNYHYALPLPRWRGGSAAALSVVVHAAVAALVLWRGAVWFESRGGDRPEVSWVALPPIPSPQAETPPTPPPRVTVPTVAPPRIERVNFATSPRVIATPLPVPLPAVPGPLPGPVGIDEGGRNCGAGSEVGASPVADAGPSSGDSADIFGPTPPLMPTAPAKAPTDDRRTHHVQFWIRADGRVTRIAVRPPIRDSDYRRRFREAMSTFVFGPVKTPDGRPIDYVYNCVVYP